jgi:hypothetical protein
MKQAGRFCDCIKQVRQTVKTRKGSPRGPAGKEQAAIAICVKSVLQTRGRTLKKFRCRVPKGAKGAKGTRSAKGAKGTRSAKDPKLETQPLIRK